MLFDCIHADKRPSYHGEQSPEGQHPMATRQRAFTFSYTLMHVHTHAHNSHAPTPLEQLKAIWSHSPQAGPLGFPRESASPHARSPAMQLPSTLQASSPWDATQPFPLVQSFLSVSDIHHVSQQEKTHASTPQNAPDVIKAGEAKENRDWSVWERGEEERNLGVWWQGCSGWWWVQWMESRTGIQTPRLQSLLPPASLWDLGSFPQTSFRFEILAIGPRKLALEAML